MTTGEIIRALRKQRGWSQAELARRLGVKGNSRVANWETGNNQPDTKALFLIAQNFGVSVDFLLNGGNPVLPGDHAALAALTGESEPLSKPHQISGNELKGPSDNEFPIAMREHLEAFLATVENDLKGQAWGLVQMQIALPLDKFPLSKK